MVNKRKLSTATKWFIGIIGALAIGVGGNIIDRTLNINILPKSITNAFTWSINKVSSALLYRIPIWLVLIIVIAVVALLVLTVRKLIVNQQQPDIIDKYPFINYTHDEFGVDKTKWKWAYNTQGNTPTIINLKPACEYCDSKMSIDEYQTDWATIATKCPKCRLEGRRFEYVVKQLVLC